MLSASTPGVSSISPTQPTAFKQGFLPLSLLKSGQFLYLLPESQGGLIIQKGFYADFVGPGGAVGCSFDVTSTSVYVVGNVKFGSPGTYAERQHAFQRRIAYAQELSDIVSSFAPLHRAYRIVNQLAAWIGAEEANKIPVELMARMAGVLPRTIVQVRRQRPTSMHQQVVNQDAMETLIVH